ncbi:MAG: DNA gyrase C-terminal beta-propeller domain-containing protein, partial [Chloroflexota bacterium]
LANPRRILVLVQQEVSELKSQYGDPRRTELMEQGVLDFSEEDLIPHQEVMVTLSERGFIKRVPSRSFTPQHRGGKGIIGFVTREADAVRLLTVADTHDDIFFFTNRGKVFNLKCHEIPSDVSRTSKGTAVINLFSVVEKERVTAMVDVTKFVPGTYMLLATSRGEIKKTSVDSFAAVRSSGHITMDLEPADELVAACLATDEDDVILVTGKGKSIRFRVASLRASSRTSGGVRAIRLAPGDRMVSMDKVIPEGFLLVVTELGYGKLTPLIQYPRQQRAGGGVLTFKTTEKTGQVTGARLVLLTEQVMIISAEGIVTRTPVREKDPRHGITIIGRNTQGVRMMRLDPGDKVVAIAAFVSQF